MIIEQKKLSSDDFYRIMIQAIIPRPIAWVLSRNSNGSFNVAPFSFFNGVASEPPILMISVAQKEEGVRKDTWINIEARREFVVHIPPGEMADAVVATSKALPHGESEIDLAELKTAVVEGWSLPRIQGPRLAMLCEKHQIIEVGTEPTGLILGELRAIWVDDAIVTTEKGRPAIDPHQINPLARLGGPSYGTLGDIFTVNRPK
jgi:flavin reductase (DIM6/NTAB) family NADH-FMN oxidoreductase RutF